MLNEEYFKEDFLLALAKQFQCLEPTSALPNGASVLTDAFPLAVLPNFLDEASAKALREMLQSLPFKHKAMDLFDFHQSPDLKSFLNQPDNPITKLCTEIFSPAFTSAIGKIIGKPLGTEIDFAAQCYKQSQYLLCHDDRLESRRVAFVLYLVDPAWDSAKDGGQIELFRTNYRGEPSPRDSQRFTPAWNTLVFFEVSMWSHHQVCEVLGNLPRFSYAGWLHDPKPVESSAASKVEPSESIDEESLSEIRELIKGKSYELEPVLNPNASFQRLFFRQREPKILLNLLRKSLSEHPGADWPTLPVILRLSPDQHHFMEAYPLDYMFEEEERRMVHIASLHPEIAINGTQIKEGQIHRINATSKDSPTLTIAADHEAYVAIWSIKLP
jgi:Rps23 Pro-64 3,4-dihydroxylase Tpa1-like proline 4-hydroxylase